MFCCVDWPSSELTAFPGRRSSSEYVFEDYQKDESDDYGLIGVIVPEGVSEGQILHVTAPDGSGRIIAAPVPAGLDSGSMFHVKYPKLQEESFPPQAPTPSPNTHESAASAPLEEPDRTVGAQPLPFSTDAQANTVASAPSFPRQEESANMQYSTDAQTNTVASAPSFPRQEESSNMLLVKTPPGTAPGTTIHVQIPGENRVIAAVVPDGVSEFYVTYEPRQGPPHDQNNTTQVIHGIGSSSQLPEEMVPSYQKKK